MYLIKCEMWGIKIFFDVDNKIVLVIVLSVILSGVVFFGGVVMMCIIFDFKILLGVVVFGLVGGLFCIVLIVLEFLDDFEIVCKKVYKVRMNVFIKEKIRFVLWIWYVDVIWKIIE